MSKTETPILVIIDMQPEFSASQNKVLLSNLCREIRRFKAKGWPILVVEYSYHGRNNLMPNWFRTDRRLIRVIGDYDKAWFVVKARDDGSKEVERAIRHIPLYCLQSIPVLYIAGVSASACVRATVQGLGRNMPNATINVIADCCGDWGDRMTFLEREPLNFPANVVLQRQEAMT